MRFTLTLAILFVTTMIMLIFGLRGMLVKRPIVYPARSHYWFLVLAFAPMIISFTDMMFDPFDGSFDFLGLLLALMFVGLLILFWQQMNGYFASGITDESFQTALHSSLEKLNLPYKESLSRVELTSMGVDLQASVQPWSGTAQLKMKQRGHKQTLRDIARSMNEYYKGTPVKANLAPSIVYTVTGILMLLVLIYLIVSRIKRGV